MASVSDAATMAVGRSARARIASADRAGALRPCSARPTSSSRMARPSVRRACSTPRRRRRLDANPKPGRGTSPTNPSRRWPRSSRWRAASRPPPTSSVTTRGSRRWWASTRTTGSRSRGSAPARPRAGAMETRISPSMRSGRAISRRMASRRAADSTFIAIMSSPAATSPASMPAEALDDRRTGQERDDDSDGLGPPERQAAGGRARDEVELVDDRLDTRARLRVDVRPAR